MLQSRRLSSWMLPGMPTPSSAVVNGTSPTLSSVYSVSFITAVGVVQKTVLCNLALARESFLKVSGCKFSQGFVSVNHIMHHEIMTLTRLW